MLRRRSFSGETQQQQRLRQERSPKQQQVADPEEEKGDKFSAVNGTFTEKDPGLSECSSSSSDRSKKNRFVGLFAVGNNRSMSAARRVVALVVVFLFVCMVVLFVEDPVLVALRPKIVRWGFDQRIRLAREARSWLTDGSMHVVLLGTGSPLADPTRASQSVAVIAGGEFLVFDAGDGSVENALLYNMPLGNLSAIALTHYHSDHIADLGEMSLWSWIQGNAHRTSGLPVFGPPGIDALCEGYNQIYSFDKRYRIEHHNRDGRGILLHPSARDMEPHAVLLEEHGTTTTTTFFDKGGLKAEAFLVHHEPVKPAYGYRVSYGGRTIVISGDTKECDEVKAVAKNADVLVHDATNHEVIEMVASAVEEFGPPEETAPTLIRDATEYHATPPQALAVAAAAGVGLLVLVHMVPPPSNAVTRKMLGLGWGAKKKQWHGSWVNGEDGMHFVLPPHPSKEIHRTVVPTFY